MVSGSKKGNNAAEIDRLALAFAKEPGSKVFIPLAEECGKAAMWEEAAAVLEEGLRSYPGFITAMVALGRAYDQMNQPIKAQAILEEAIKLSPDNLRAHRTLAKLYAAQGMTDAAVRSCNVILALNPQDQEALALCAGLEIPTAQGGVTDAGGVGVQENQTNTLASDPEQGEPLASALDETALFGSDEVDGRPRQVTRPNENMTDTDITKTSRLEEAWKTKSVLVLQLEHWLKSVQIRRRDSQGLSQPYSKTSP